ncbi:MAG TPA: hypothetical protein ENH86_01560 [Candidatus Jorgensenbacteria bacterium]|nr:hypothetical protein [Candidatus Jorgensenbacteria bacterium]
MAITLAQSSLQNTLQEVPEDIRSWISSEKTTYFMMELNEKLGLREERVRIIPRLLLRLEVKDLHAAEFVDAISQELTIGPEKAKSIAIELKENILKPIEASLSDWDINIDLIDVEGGIALKKTKATTYQKEGVTKERVSKIKEEEIVPLAPITSQEPKIIHQEERVSVSKTKTPRRSFILSPGIFKQKGVIKSETPVARITTPKKKGGSHTVHYSELRTPVPGGMMGEGFIDLTKLGPASKGAIPYQNIPPQKSEQGTQRSPSLKSGGVAKQKKERGPKLDGNTVDLRNTNT